MESLERVPVALESSPYNSGVRIALCILEVVMSEAKHIGIVAPHGLIRRIFVPAKQASN